MGGGLRAACSWRRSGRIGGEEYFDLVSVKDAPCAEKNAGMANGTEAWACCNCECTRRLEEKPPGDAASLP